MWKISTMIWCMIRSAITLMRCKLWWHSINLLLNKVLLRKRILIIIHERLIQRYLANIMIVWRSIAMSLSRTDSLIKSWSHKLSSLASSLFPIILRVSLSLSNLVLLKISVIFWTIVLNISTYIKKIWVLLFNRNVIAILNCLFFFSYAWKFLAILL
jgi:hypothetical protein